MHPSIHSATQGSKLAIIMAGRGETVTYRQLDDRSNQIAQLFRAWGLAAGDCVAVLLENSARYFEICWAAQRAGLYYCCISTKLTPGEAAYIVADSDARALIASDTTWRMAEAIVLQVGDIATFKTGPACGPFRSLDADMAEFPPFPIDDEACGIEMLYSSGTTGRPKGVKPARPVGPITQPTGLTNLGARLYGLDQASIFLSPAPLYHAAPLRWCMTVQRLGGTCVVMEKFDAEQVLALIERYRVSHAQFVPTHFIRMLKLPHTVRAQYDLSSLEAVFHAAAPCPVPVKHRMIDWWGAIIHEYYAGTESNGYTAISPTEWLTHPGSVGRSMWGEVKICDEEDHCLPVGEEGAIYFANGPKFSYHKDPEKTAAATNRYGWTTLGDIGRLDEKGFLYLTDRKDFTIISGGVNIYPQEIENLLVTHPQVADIAVIGAPDDDLGERVVAVVQPSDPAEAGPRLAEALIDFAKAGLSHVKAPRQVDFVEELPRLPTGKLLKRLVRDRYWQPIDSATHPKRASTPTADVAKKAKPRTQASKARR